MARLGHGLLTAATLWAVSLGTAASPAGEGAFQQAATQAQVQTPLSLPPALGQRLFAASRRAHAAAAAFGSLRQEIGRHADLATSIVEGLGLEEISLLNGSAPACEALGERFRAAQVNGLELSRRLTDGDHEEVVQHVPIFCEELETLAQDVDAHFARIRELALSKLSSGERDKLAAAVATPLASSAGTESRSTNTGRENALVVGIAADVAAELTRLNTFARQLADRADASMLTEARRLGARVARLEAQGSGNVEDWEVLQEAAREKLALAERLLTAPRSSSSGSAGQASGRAAAPKPFTWRPGDGCSADAVTAAAGHFDAVMKKFRGPVLQAMLPPEVENLHRVVHALEVMKNSLLAELSSSTSPTGCEKYFAGVGQLETDLGYYKGLIAKKKRKGRRKQQKGRPLDALTVIPAASGELPKGRRSKPALSALNF